MQEGAEESEETIEGTLADKELPQYESNLADSILAEHSTYGDPDRYPELHRVFGESQRWVAQNGNPWPAILRSVYQRLMPAIDRLGPHLGHSTRIRFAIVADGSITSRYLPYRDGSGIVLISQGIFALSEAVARPLADVVLSLFAATGFIDLFKRIRSVHKQATLSEYDLAVKSTLIRYNLINRMLLDNIGNLHYELPPKGEQILDALREQYITFIVAHEVAHHLLGHGDAMRGFSPGDDRRQCSDDQEKELAADALALKILTTDSNSNSYLPAVGAFLAFTAVVIAEECLFVRKYSEVM